MTAEPNRKPEGIPTGGQFAKKTQSDDVVALAVTPEPPKKLGRVLSDRYLAAKAQMEAHDQNEWVKDVHEEHPEAAYANVNIECDAGGRFTAGMDLYAADGSPIDLDGDDAEALESDFDTDWDMTRHANKEVESLFNSNAKAFSLKSIQDRWSEIESSTEPAVDPFAHLSGMDKAKAQATFARKLNEEAVAEYVEGLISNVLEKHPDAARINVSRRVDVEYGHSFTLESVTNDAGDVLDVDLSALQDEFFQDIYLDPYTDYDEAEGQLYIELDPTK